MLPDLVSGIDCKKAVDYFTLEGFLSTDAWLILPFLLGMLFYALRHKLCNGIISFGRSEELSESKLDFEEKKTGYGYRRGSELGGSLTA